MGMVNHPVTLLKKLVRESMKQQVVINSEQYIEVTIYDIVILQIPKKC